MSNTYSGITARKFNALMDELQISIGTTNFVCMANDYIDGSSWGGSMEKAKAKVNRRAEKYNDMQDKPIYFINLHSNSLKEHVGCRVYKTPADFDGIHDEYELDKYEEAGTLLKVNNRWIVETDLVKMEIMRRELTFKSMAEGNHHIGFTDNQEDNKNPVKYKAYLEAKDKEAGHIITHGHGIF
jgi:hypothetical protein